MEGFEFAFALDARGLAVLLFLFGLFELRLDAAHFGLETQCLLVPTRAARLAVSRLNVLCRSRWTLRGRLFFFGLQLPPCKIKRE